MTKKQLWTLVQHTAYTVVRNPQFRYAVELHGIDTKKDADKVRKAYGLLFESYDKASEREEAENYPPEVHGLTPRVKGHFSTIEVDGNPIYVPSSIRETEILLAPTVQEQRDALLEVVRDFRAVFGKAVEEDKPIAGADAVDWISNNWPKFRRALAIAEAPTLLEQLAADHRMSNHGGGPKESCPLCATVKVVQSDR